ncbi:MAG: N-acetylmuramoyl-L-alanine amidase [Gemmatimonadota bacterium]|nr:N-acetylmuramoyl-L-alanine amidase [Gemmatimonadota bacterium]MDP6803137.1 N-acetylmuramoyl-L-alanine amidase [Gemmatimonadota bacterium]
MIPRRTPLLLLTVALLASPPPVRAAVGVLAVRHWSAPDHTRIVIDLAGPSRFTHRSLTGPDRFAVDIARARFRFPRDAVTVNDGLVKRLRFNALSRSGAAQVVVDLEQPSPCRVFSLAKIDSKPDRIVIDVTRAAPPAPPRAEVPAPRPPPADGPGGFLVMIDPGHGGEDPGRHNPDGLKEKTLALDLSRQLQAEINGRTGYRAKLTRTGDYFVPLANRGDIARDAAADLFVSIHFNAAQVRSARGTEVYFVSMRGATTHAVRELEAVENSADLVGGLPPGDPARADDLTRILVDVRQNDTVDRSQRLATILTDSVDQRSRVPTRAVKQAGFAVLKQLFVPAVLVEAGFLTNRHDERFFRSSRNREKYARALADGIVRYCEEVEMPRRGWAVHEVHRGDTLSEIARQYGMTVPALRSANRLSGDRILVGQKLRVRRG